MTTVSVQEAQHRLWELIAQAARGEEVILTDGEKPLARLTSFQEERKRVADLHPGAIHIADDFDEPLPDEFWLGQET